MHVTEPSHRHIKKKSGAGRKYLSLKVDMTPMVDLGFLLITFFVITTELSKPRTIALFMPKDGNEMPLPESNALTVLLGNNDRLFYYTGKWKGSELEKHVFESGYSFNSGIGTIIKEKQKQLDAGSRFGVGRKELMVIVKAHENATYNRIIDIMDEFLINEVKKYAIIKPTAEEINFLNLH